MMNGIGKTGGGRVDTLRPQFGQAPSLRQAKGEDAPASVAGWQPTSAAGSEAPVDSAKVARIRAEIASGRYQIDANAIADAMIAQDLPGLK